MPTRDPTRAAIVAACRRLMQAGRLRPTTRAFCGRAGWPTRTGHRRFGPATALHCAHGARLRLAAPLATVQGSQWMPKPAEFRRLVQARLDERRLAPLETGAPERWVLDDAAAAIDAAEEGRSAP